MRITYASRHGKYKSASEDCILINNRLYNNTAGSIDLDPQCICIADGVGGVPGGYDASRFVLGHFSDSRGYANAEELKGYLQELNRSLIAYAADKNEKKAMATTFTGLVVKGRSVYLMHAGNTRLYAYNEKGLVQLTKDHTNYQAMVVDGPLDEKNDHCAKNIIYCCFGTGNPEYLRSLQVAELKLDDPPVYMMMTSDGIHDHLGNDRIESIVENNLDDRNKILELMDAADRNGSEDDCSVVIIRRKLI